MLIEIRVDHIARICIWKNARGVMAESLGMPKELRYEIEDWMDRYEELLGGSIDEDELHAAWTDFDDTGRKIAKALRPYFPASAVINYYSESLDRYE